VGGRPIVPAVHISDDRAVLGTPSLEQLGYARQSAVAIGPSKNFAINGGAANSKLIQYQGKPQSLKRRRQNAPQRLPKAPAL
jgi:hypothetical protein